MSYWRAVLEHVGSACMAQGVGCDVLLEMGKTNAALDHGPNTVGIHPLTPAVKDKISGIISIDIGGSYSKDIVSYKLTYPFTQGDYPVFISLSLYADIPAVKVKVCKLDIAYLCTLMYIEV